MHAEPERPAVTTLGNKKKNKTPQGKTTTPYMRLSPPPNTGGKRTDVITAHGRNTGKETQLNSKLPGVVSMSNLVVENTKEPNNSQPSARASNRPSPRPSARASNRPSARASNSDLQNLCPTLSDV
eukprot:6020270-Pleurochrysis_carterae.AAC.1